MINFKIYFIYLYYFIPPNIHSHNFGEKTALLVLESNKTLFRACLGPHTYMEGPVYGETTTTNDEPC